MLSGNKGLSFFVPDLTLTKVNNEAFQKVRLRSCIIYAQIIGISRRQTLHLSLWDTELLH